MSKTKLKRFCDVRSGWQGRRVVDYSNDGHPILCSHNVVAGAITPIGEIKNIDPDDYPSIHERHWAKDGDIAILRSCGYQAKRHPAVCIPDSPGMVVPHNYHILTFDKSVVNPLFMAVYFNSHVFQRWSSAYAHGTVMLVLSVNDLKNHEVRIPDINDQDKIAELFSNIAKLKELNRKKEEKFNEILDAFVYEKMVKEPADERQPVA